MANLKLQIENNYGGDLMKIKFHSEVKNAFGIYMKIDSLWETNNRKIKNTKDCYFNNNYEFKAFNQEGEAEFNIMLHPNVLPSYKTRHFSISYILNAILIEKENKRYYETVIDIENTNLLDKNVLNENKIKFTNRNSYMNRKNEICEKLLKNFFEEDKNTLIEDESTGNYKWIGR